MIPEEIMSDYFMKVSLLPVYIENTDYSRVQSTDRHRSRIHIRRKA